GTGAYQGLADGGLHASQLAVQSLKRGRDRGVGQVLIGLEGGIHRRSRPAGDLNQQLDQGAEGQFAGVVVGSVVVEELGQQLVVEEPLQGATDQNAQRQRLHVQQEALGNVAEAVQGQQFRQRIAWPRWGSQTHPCLVGQDKGKALPSPTIRQLQRC